LKEIKYEEEDVLKNIDLLTIKKIQNEENLYWEKDNNLKKKNARKNDTITKK
jgi:hypothetical protein